LAQASCSSNNSEILEPLSISEMVAFDVASAIAEFVVDAERNSLELPHMTTGERKHAKQLLEKYPQLRCESYGFGSERQLHLFKKAASPETASRLPFGGNLSNNREVSFPVHGDLKVRNTFIHYGDAPADKRAVQSMPHGMFRQCILTECVQKSMACEEEYPDSVFPPTPTSDAEADPIDYIVNEQTFKLCVGALVVVEGLVKAPAFNGRSAVVQGWDEATGRYSILLASSDGSQEAKIKEENLRMVLPCP